ncbi:hypothetical protein [Dictyobacter aurantiacus]|uniref:hypothetical protein n=1 Tax=Dictyobacter aurantiacus TaxID=1936993 RepID=UPI000F82516A|nr:hypothetical protein [Dictyobacter aurantiacus]
MKVMNFVLLLGVVVLLLLGEALVFTSISPDARANVASDARSVSQVHRTHVLAAEAKPKCTSHQKLMCVKVSCVHCQKAGKKKGDCFPVLPGEKHHYKEEICHCSQWACTKKGNW